MFTLNVFPMKVVIMAGGKGTRIATIKSDVPKPMIPIAGKPILEWQINCLRSQGLKDIILVIGYLGHVIKDYFGDGSRFGVNISYFVEDKPLGTAGALFKMLDNHTDKDLCLDDDFLLMCGDVILDVDFNRFIEFHKEHQAWASLMAHPNGHPYDSSLLVTQIAYGHTDITDTTDSLSLAASAENAEIYPIDTHRVIRWMNKEDERVYYKNRVNAGIEIISPELLKHTMATSPIFNSQFSISNSKVDLDRDVLKPNIASGKIFAYDTPEYIKDMGTPDRYYEVEQDIKTGKVNARNLQQKQKAVFLDRDGTINKYVGFLTKAEQFELIGGVAETIKRINKSGYLAIVVTNQPVIARGECTWEELQEIHNKMETELGKEGAYVDAIYICPHHPDKGFAGERPEYKHECNCRKPAPGLLEQAARDFNIDLSQSIMIGDSESDVKAGENAGCKVSLKIETDRPMFCLMQLD